ncbi:MAG: PA2169 family four-helix-bundle protein [Balneolaceae bacterium]
MGKSEVIDILNELVVVNNDRIEGYETASEISGEIELKNMFAEFAQTSHKCKRELMEVVLSLGGSMATGTKTTGKFFRAWIEVKSALIEKDRKTVLESCGYGEEKALETYREAIREEAQHLTTEQQTIIGAQYASIKSDYERLKSMNRTLEIA